MIQHSVARLGVACACALLALPAAARADWGTFQGNARHDGRVAGTYDPAAFSFAWTRSLPSLDGYMSVNPVAIGGGKVFVSRTGYHPGSSPHLYALNASSGTTAWTKTFAPSPGAVNSSFIFSVNDPAYANGRVFLVTCNYEDDTWFLGFDANTGAQVAKQPVSADFENFYAPTIADGVAYVGSANYGGAHAFNTTTGQLAWENYGLPGYDQWTPAIGPTHAYAYLGLYTPGLYAINRQTGAFDWRVDDPAFGFSGWSVEGAVALGAQNDAIAVNEVVNGPDRLISFDLASRSIRWVKNGEFDTRQATIHDGKVIVAAENTVQVRSEETGDLLWTWTSPDADWMTTPVLATDNLLFVGDGVKTYAIDLLTHASPWSYPQGGTLALDSNALFITRGDGVITKINVPEPTGIAVAAGVVAIAAARRRRANRTATSAPKHATDARTPPEFAAR